MRWWTFDLDSDSLYVSLGDAVPARQVELPSGAVVDVDQVGRAVGVEILRASTGWDPDEIDARFNIDRADLESLKWLSLTQFQVAPGQRSGLTSRAAGEPGTDQTILELLSA
jgi:uncharacterized protein YuzE